MEFLTILLTSLLVLVSPAGLVIDRTVANAIRSRFEKVEQLQVRVDNAPSHQILQGKVERLRMASRGLWLTKDIRIDTLDLESDRLDLDIQRLRQAKQRLSMASLQKPVQAGAHLVFTEVDTNQALKSPAVNARLQQVLNRLLSSSDTQGAQGYQLLNPRVEFLGNNRLRFQAQLKEPAKTEPLSIIGESGLGIIAGRRLQLISPTLSVNGKPIPPQIVTALTARFSNRADLGRLEDAGIIARLLQLKIDSDRLELAAFVRLDRTKSASTPNPP